MFSGSLSARAGGYLKIYWIRNKNGTRWQTADSTGSTARRANAVKKVKATRWRLRKRLSQAKRLEWHRRQPAKQRRIARKMRQTDAAVKLRGLKTMASNKKEAAS